MPGPFRRMRQAAGRDLQLAQLSESSAMYVTVLVSLVRLSAFSSRCHVHLHLEWRQYLGLESLAELVPGDSGDIRGERMSARSMACPLVGQRASTVDSWRGMDKGAGCCPCPLSSELCPIRGEVCVAEGCEKEPFMNWGSGAQFL